MSNSKLDEFLNANVPGKGYHAFNGEIELYNEKRLSFECACGKTHPVKTSFAVIDLPLENKALYVCPDNENLVVLVKAKGMLSVKGLKTIASHEMASKDEKQDVLSMLESRKKRDKYG